MLNKAVRLVKYGAIASIVSGSVVALQSNEWNVLSTGIVRFGRAAVAVCVFTICIYSYLYILQT